MVLELSGVISPLYRYLKHKSHDVYTYLRHKNHDVIMIVMVLEIPHSKR